jgi:hypothetical protein
MTSIKRLCGILHICYAHDDCAYAWMDGSVHVQRNVPTYTYLNRRKHNSVFERRSNLRRTAQDATRTIRTHSYADLYAFSEIKVAKLTNSGTCLTTSVFRILQNLITIAEYDVISYWHQSLRKRAYTSANESSTTTCVVWSGVLQTSGWALESWHPVRRPVLSVRRIE